MGGDDDDSFDRSELEELIGVDALYPERENRPRSLHKLCRASASYGLCEDGHELLLEEEDEREDELELDEDDDDL